MKRHIIYLWRPNSFGDAKHYVLRYLGALVRNTDEIVNSSLNVCVLVFGSLSLLDI
jgi:hypothetical protein